MSLQKVKANQGVARTQIDFVWLTFLSSCQNNENATRQLDHTKSNSKSERKQTVK
jgi:hypothetical protein